MNTGQIRIALAQINPTVGDLVANAALVRTNFKTAQDAGAHIVVFTDMVFTGYPVEDLSLRPSFQQVDGRSTVLILCRRSAV